MIIKGNSQISISMLYDFNRENYRFPKYVIKKNVKGFSIA